MAQRNWTPEQQFCIDDNGGTVLVSAAAGSGKTSVLVERIIRKITHPEHPASVDRLLVVTFTNAAAAEMKHRIADQLTECVALDPENTHLQRQLLALPRASISTVDGFCATLLRENAYRLNLSAQFKIAEEQQMTLLRGEALQETLDECYRSKDPHFLNLAASLSNGKNDRALMASIDRIYTFIQSHPYPEQWLSDMQSIYDENVPIAQTVWGQAVLGQLQNALKASVALLSKAASLCSFDAALADKYYPSIQQDIAVFSNLIDRIQDGLGWDDCFAHISALKLTPLSAVRNCGDEDAKQRIGDLRKEVTSQITAMQKLYCGTEAQCRTDLRTTRHSVTALYDAVRVFSRVFAQKKQENNLLDFNDIEHLALQLLVTREADGTQRPTALAQELSTQFDEIMVDEYQDTNATQDALFSALSRDESNLFYVGDVKQSIYGFRQAMPELFLNRRARYAPHVTKQYPVTVTLGNNFRSRQTVTDSVNFIFHQLMTEQTGGIVYNEQEELVCSAGYDERDGYETECLILDGKAIKNDDLDRDTAEARVIAEQIRRCMNDLTVSDKNGPRKPQYNDFCILLRNRKSHAAAYREELERQGIPISCDSDTAFFDTAEIRLALSLLRCIDNPTLDVPLTAVLLSPLYGFSADDLAAIRLFHPQSCLYLSLCAARKHEDAQLASRCAAFVEQLTKYRTLAATVAVDVLLRRLYEETLLPDLMSARNNGEQRRENLEILYDRCCMFEDNGFRGLSAFVRFMDRLHESGNAFSTVKTTVAGNGVHLMSIHGSKGLEFPFVFIAGLCATFNHESSTGDLLLHASLGAGMQHRDPETYNRYITLPFCGLSIHLRNDDRAEELRVLYVAMTRAREKLYLIITQDNLNRKLDALSTAFDEDQPLSAFAVQTASSMGDWILAALLRHPSANELRNRTVLRDASVLPAKTDCRIAVCDVPPAEMPTETERIVVSEDAALTARLRERLAYRYPHKRLSETPAKVAASETAHDTVDLGHIAVSRPAFLSKSGLTAAERGTAMHDFMQYANFGEAQKDVDGEAFRLVNQGFLTAEQADALDKKALSAFFKSDLYDRMRRAVRCLREFHFTAKQIPDGDTALPDGIFTIVQGITDCLIEEEDGWVIVDYKTDSVKTAQQLLDRYRPQLAIYRQYLSPILDKPIKDCLLYSFKLNCTVRVD